jgi:hypothetical protein
MEDLFRFAQIRRPYRLGHEVDAIELASGSPFQAALAAVTAPNERTKWKAHAAMFVNGGSFVTGEDSSPFLELMERVAGAVDGAVAAGPVGHAVLDALLNSELGQPPGGFVADPATIAAVCDLKDSIVAIKLLPEQHHRPIARLVDALRTFELINRADSDQLFPSSNDGLGAYRRRALKLPAAIVRPQRGRQERPRPSSIVADLKSIADRYAEIETAIKEMRALRPQDMIIAGQAELPERLAPENMRPTALFGEELAVRHKALAATVLASGATISDSAGDLAKLAGAVPSILAGSRAAALDGVAPEAPGLRFGRGARVALTGRPAFSPVGAEAAMRPNPGAIKRLSEPTKATLTRLGLDPQTPLPATVDALLTELRATHEAAQQLVRPLLPQSFRRVGSAMVALADAAAARALRASPTELLDLIGPLAGVASDPTVASVPATSADIRPAGLMDLLLVRQQLKRYEAADIAHVENVLRGELRERLHRRTYESETTLFRETETETETESELATTDRFEMRRESQRALDEQASVSGSLTVSGSYGPTFEFEASGESSWSRRTSETTTAASEVGREVTQRASARILERVIRRETRRTRLETEDTDRHTIDNSRGTADVVGTYQWLTKIYEAQVYNYGARTLYELTVPEPGAQLLASFRRTRAEAIELVEPPPFDVKPGELKTDTYQKFVTLYGATGVKPPPLPYVTEAYDFNTGGEDENQEFTNSTRIKIPDGYAAFQASVGITVAVWDNWCVDVVIGQRSHRFASGTWVWHIGLNGEVGTVPFALTTDKVGDIAVAVEVICKATDRAFELWQAETHAELVDAFRARRSEYETQLAALESEAPLEIVSRSEARNRELIATELKRACISVLGEHHFDLFAAVTAAADGLPQIDFPEALAEGAYARFFEQALEWSNTAWVMYPYYWGRRSEWTDRISIQDGDPVFEELLKAGFARVVVPVRPGFEAAMDHFRFHGEPWGGGPLPTISDLTYLPIADEIAERLGGPGDEVPKGDPWEVRVPTDLVRLRDAPGLPSWVKQQDGSWLPS